MSHATDHPAELPPEADEELVAYLDGELDEAGVRRVEMRLAEDAEYRRDLARLQHAWDCLDELPETPLDQNFTRSTIEMVALAAEEDLTTAQSVWPQTMRARLFRSFGLLFGALAAGFILVSSVWPSPGEQLARDLPILEQLDELLPIDNIEYLRQLAAAKLLPAVETEPTPEDTSQTPDAGEKQPDSTPAATGPAGERATPLHLASLSAEEKAELAISEQRFARLRPEEQQRLRALAGEVAAAPDRELLEETLIRYHAWLAKLSPGQQAELAGLAPEQRLGEVKKLAEIQARLRSRELTPEDRTALLSFLEKYLVAHREELVQQLPESRRREMAKWIQQANGQQLSGMLLMMYWQRNRSAEYTPKLPTFTEAEVQQLLDSLSPAARAQWNSLQKPEDKRRLVSGWITEAIRQRMNDRTSSRDALEISQEQLEHFFVTELSSEQRAELLAMPREEMDRALRRMALEGKQGERVRFFDWGKHGPPGRPGEGPPERHGDYPRHPGPPGEGRGFDRPGPRGEFGPPPEHDKPEGHRPPPFTGDKDKRKERPREGEGGYRRGPGDARPGFGPPPKRPESSREDTPAQEKPAEK